MNNKKPFYWVPSLYLGEALPFSAVMLISVIMFKEFGLSDGQITVYTGWMGLPWVIKPIWSPIIDNLKTKRWWIVSMQFFMGIALAMVAFTLPTSFRIQGTLAIFMLIAFASATHDISADGFYIIGLKEKDQEWYVGIRNTFYRIGMVIGQGGLVLLAGHLQEGRFGQAFQSTATSWLVVFLILGVLMILLATYHSFVLPKVEVATHERFNFMEQMREFVATLKVFITKPHIVSALCFILLFRLWYHWWMGCFEMGIEEVSLAVGFVYHAARCRLCLSEFLPHRQSLAYGNLCVHRADWLRTGIRCLYALPRHLLTW